MPSYPAVLAVHLLAVLAFLAGLFVVTAMLAAAPAGAPDPAAAREWRRIVAINRWGTTVALALVWAAGLTLAHEGGWFADAWLHAKIACVAGLTALHGWQSHRLAARAAGMPARLPRWTLAVPPVLATAIVYLVTVKPG